MKISNSAVIKPVALITGATGGIGSAVAVELAKKDIHVVLLGRNENKLLKITKQIQELGGEVDYIVVDFLSLTSVSEVLVELRARELVPQILINALGGSFKSEDWSNEKIYREVYRLNTEVAIELTNQLLPIMSTLDWGRIIHFGSLSIKTGINSLPYIVAKSALISFVQFAAGRIALDSPQVVLAAISPGPISIPGKYLNGLEREKPEELLLWFKLNRIPTMRLLKVEEILNLVNYIISEDGSYMNGSVIDINGGAG